MFTFQMFIRERANRAHSPSDYITKTTLKSYIVHLKYKTKGLVRWIRFLDQHFEVKIVLSRMGTEVTHFVLATAYTTKRLIVSLHY